MNEMEDWVWFTKKGETVLMMEMEETHLINSIKLMEKVTDQVSETERVAWSVASGFQGEMAQYYADQECDKLSETAFNCMVMLQRLIEVAKFRKINFHDKQSATKTQVLGVRTGRLKRKGG